jgi:hypothetical protein
MLVRVLNVLMLVLVRNVLMLVRNVLNVRWMIERRRGV